MSEKLVTFLLLEVDFYHLLIIKCMPNGLSVAHSDRTSFIEYFVHGLLRSLQMAPSSYSLCELQRVQHSHHYLSKVYAIRSNF